MNVIDPKTLKIVKGLPPKAKKGDRVSLDSEFFNQEKARLHRPHGTFAFLGCSFDNQTVYYITDSSQIQEFMDRLNESVHIWMNAKYDFTQLRAYAKIPDRDRIWDVQLIEQIRFGGYYSDFSLQDLARRYLDIYLEKDVRAEFGEYDAPEPSGSDLEPFYEMSQEMLEYSCVDVVVTRMVYEKQKEQIDEIDLNIWKDIERPFLWVLLDMPGMPMDRDAWIALYEKNQADADAIQKSYIEWDESKYTMREAIKKNKYTGINLGSADQVGKEIIRRGYTLPKTKTGKPSTDEDNIKHIVDDEFVADVLEFRGKSKLASTYGSSWLKNELLEENGRVYSSFHQMGAATGRLSSSKPNVQNLPVRETPDFRKCFTAIPGFILIDADWSSQEPRIATYLSCDEKMLKIFQEHKDVYIESARLMFGWELDKKDPRRKTHMKPTVLGASYGLTEHGMEKKYGIPKEEGKMYLETFFDTFEGMREWKIRQQQITDFVTTIYGRKYWLNPYTQGSENNALNSPVQGSGGDGIKIAGAAFRKEIYTNGYQNDVFIINFIHDEILVMAREGLKDWTMETLKRVMIDTAETMHEGIPADVEIGFGYTWHEAHG